jgi:hypothetical protein
MAGCVARLATDRKRRGTAGKPVSYASLCSHALPCGCPLRPGRSSLASVWRTFGACSTTTHNWAATLLATGHALRGAASRRRHIKMPGQSARSSCRHPVGHRKAPIFARRGQEATGRGGHGFSWSSILAGRLAFSQRRTYLFRGEMHGRRKTFRLTADCRVVLVQLFAL